MLEAFAELPLATPNAIVDHKLRSLDGLRAIAILLVFFHHMKDHIPAVNFATRVTKTYLDLGWMGVDLFFVLSGFLITGILLDTRAASNFFAGFYARRVLRIFPLYYLVLTVVIIAGIELHNPALTATLPLPGDRWLYYCYLTNWLVLWKDTWHGNYLAHFWSLAVEEQFYLFWPLMVWLVRPRAIPWFVGALATLAALIRIAWVHHSGPQQAIALATITRMDALFIGALCAFLYRNRERMLKVRKWLPWVASMGVGSFVAGVAAINNFPAQTTLLFYGSSTISHTSDDQISMFTEYAGFVLLALGFGALVLLAAQAEPENTGMQKLLKSRWLAPIGLYSYGIYVFHVPIAGAASIYLYPLIRSIDSTTKHVITECAYILIIAAVTFGISALSYEFFEKRILRFKRFFEAKDAPVRPATNLDDRSVHIAHDPLLEVSES
jgi:peptidoglycan/LPS O-acetylase OafA/YrhL